MWTWIMIGYVLYVKPHLLEKEYTWAQQQQNNQKLWTNEKSR